MQTKLSYRCLKNPFPSDQLEITFLKNTFPRQVYTYTLLKCLKHLFNHSGLENAKDIWSRILPSLILVDLEMY